MSKRLRCGLSEIITREILFWGFFGKVSQAASERSEGKPHSRLERISSSLESELAKAREPALDLESARESVQVEVGFFLLTLWSIPFQGSSGYGLLLRSKNFALYFQLIEQSALKLG